MDDTPRAEHPAQVGAYRLARLLGRGGMGAVYEGLHAHTGARVAVKLLHAGSDDPPHRARLRQEARVLAQLDHPGIARVLGLEALADDGVALIMELVEGAALGQRLQQGPLPLPLALRVAAQVAAALAHAHAAGVVHRDLTPANVMLLPDGSARVLDFGIARRGGVSASTLHTLPQTGDQVLGTLRYMAPEQIAAPQQVDGQADVFALGAVLYEMLTGAPPFGADVPELSLLAGPPPPPAARNEAVPAWLSRLCLAMLARDPRARPTMAQVAAALSPLPPGRCPFPGLEPFTEDAAALFQGRERECAEARALLGPAPSGYRRWLQIEGQSGAGKSSLLRAGLVPTWRREGLAGQPLRAILVLRPGHAPLLALAQLLRQACPALGELTALRQRLAEPAGLALSLREVSAAAGDAAAGGGRVLLALDQLEEVLTLADEAEARQLDRLLAAALDDVDGPLHLVTTLRSDLLGQLERLPELALRLNHAGRYLLLPMNEDGLREALLGPCARAGLRAEPGLLAQVVADTAGLAGCLPLLGHALRAVYEARSGDLLTLAAYQRLGGVSGALALATADLLTSLGAAGSARARRLLLALVRVGPGGEATRRALRRDEALRAAGGDALAEQIVQRLSGGRGAGTPLSAPAQVRLLVVSADQVELIHEALLQHMPALQRWLKEDQRLLARREELDAAATSWQAMGAPREGLPQGTALAYYCGAGLPDEAAARLPALASPAALAFLEAAQRRARRRRQARRGGVALAGAGMLLLLGLWLWAAQQGRQAAQQGRLAAQRADVALAVLGRAFPEADEELAQLSGADYARGNLFQASEEGLRALADAGVSGWRLTQVRCRHLLRRLDFAINYQPQEIARHRDEARAMLAALDQQAPDSLLGRRARAEANLALGDALREAQEDSLALQHVSAVGALVPDQPQGEDRLRWARARWQSGAILLRLGRLDEAQRALADADRDLPPDHEERGFLLYYQAGVALARGAVARAQAALDQAEALERPMLDNNLGYLNYRWHLARILTLKARLRAAQGDEPGAQAARAEAVRLLEEIIAQNPRHRGYQQALAEARGLRPAPAPGAPRRGG